MSIQHNTTNHAIKGPYVNATTVGRSFNVSPRFILKLAAEGRIPCLRVSKKCVRFIEADVAAALKGRMADQ